MSKNKLEFYQPNLDYCEYLRKFDRFVPMVKGEKDNRKFLGIILDFGESLQFFAPLSSPKEKHKTIYKQSIRLH